MKITGIIVCGWIHNKNLLGLQKGCIKYNIPLSITDINDPEIYKNNIYNLVLSTDKIINNINNKIIIFGPHLSVFPQENIRGNILGYGLFNVLCEWNVNVWKEFGPLKFPLITLPFGVDTEQFIPGLHRNEIFIYYKQRNPVIFENVKKIIMSLFGHINIIVYGYYNETDYINLLQKSMFGVWVGRHESQGFALEEALSCNVPLIVLDVKTMKEEYNNGQFIYKDINKNLYATAVPWWSDKCGIVIYNESELISSIKKLIENYDYYEPRKFIEDNLSISKTFEKMINLVENLN